MRFYNSHHDLMLSVGEICGFLFDPCLRAMDLVSGGEAVKDWNGEHNAGGGFMHRGRRQGLPGTTVLIVISRKIQGRQTPRPGHRYLLLCCFELRPGRDDRRVAFLGFFQPLVNSLPCSPASPYSSARFSGSRIGVSPGTPKVYTNTENAFWSLPKHDFCPVRFLPVPSSPARYHFER